MVVNSGYNPLEIEPKLIKVWQKSNNFSATDFAKQPKYYALVEFPYPSGAGLHVGGLRSWLPMDTFVRRKRMQGANVLFPFGWDSFGLPAENYAIKTGIHPTVTVPENIAKYKSQLKSVGLSFDWSREIDTSDPKYYKWTQWIFIQLFKNGLAYKKEVPVNWCPKCKTNLADEEVLGNGTHERCGTLTEKRMQAQWLVRITKYADRLIEDLALVDFPRRIAIQQVNWIGKKNGAKVKFKIAGSDSNIEVFTTRLDTVFGVTFLVVSPDFAKNVLKGKTDIKAINPVNSEEVPVFVADYVMDEVGTGAVMGVPAHDERDMNFAKEHNLSIKSVVEEGVLVDSGKYSGMKIKEAVVEIAKDHPGKIELTHIYRLHDWVFSRQHYWGEPIPMVYCTKCGWQPIDERDLPLELPYLEHYQPSGTGESPLANAGDWLVAKCPKCGGSARRETDTMPNWAGSNWYFVRYLDPGNDKALADVDKMKYWLPVDLYQGGFEHTTLHLLYSRFIYKFLFDIGVVPTSEPYLKRRPHGIVLGADNRKMSKSFGNVVNPDEIVAKYGSDTLRLYEMFIGPFSEAVAWSEESMEGCFRFLKRVWVLYQEGIGDDPTSKNILSKLHQTIKKVDSDLENLHFNTAIAALMEFVNQWKEEGKINKDEAKEFLKLLAPFAPFITEEIYQENLNVKSQNSKFESIHTQQWPKYDTKYIKVEQVEIVVQTNGKFRDRLIVSAQEASDQAAVEKKAKENGKVSNYLAGKSIIKTVFVPGKLINFVYA